MPSEFVERELSKMGGGKVSTLEFVNQVVKQMRESGLQFDEDEVRPRIVDDLWELHKRGIIRFSDDLLQFEKLNQQANP
ncbi:hypothetical protein GCM10007981_05580 [Thermocladium modestius]|uniref:Uncharacterized protein n=1 Tax=Thermocladium modestius TaxID=62609 RepID=A0A830GUM2_9CREN|nr:hypothetical protein [Thermocladium modestius]GGP19926.1 hypothetical protein GCM10007981_05580 [Thermocladium modestius]